MGVNGLWANDRELPLVAVEVQRRAEPSHQRARGRLVRGPGAARAAHHVPHQHRPDFVPKVAAERDEGEELMRPGGERCVRLA